MRRYIDRLRRSEPVAIVLLAPAIFVLHVLEEAPGFVAWFNGLVTPGISEQSFYGVNATALVVTVVVTALAASGERGPVLLAVAWLGLLMLANGVFHLVATVVHGRYCPGAVTSLLLYLPYSAWLLAGAVRWKVARAGVVGIVAVLGALPMAIHGYLIVFAGSRLF